MRVTVKAALGVAVAGLVAGQVPDDEGLVAGSREEHVGALQNPVSPVRLLLSNKTRVSMLLTSPGR